VITFVRVVAIVATLTLAVGCGAPDRRDEASGGPRLGPASEYQIPTDVDVQTYFGSVRRVSEAASEMRFSQNLIEHLPNQGFIINGADPITLSSAVVIGRVVAVSPGSAYALPDGRQDAARSVPVPFDSPDALWRVARVEIEIEAWFGDGPSPATLQVGAFVPHPAGLDGDAELEGLAKLGRLIVVLDPDRTYSWDEDVQVIARGGALLGDIDSSGAVGFPALGVESRRFVDDATVDDLKAAWSMSPEPITIDVDMETGVLERS
jgi:hypothetical protein